MNQKSGPEPTAEAVPIQGFEKAVTDYEVSKNWQPVSDRVIRVGIAGYGVCNFGAAFHFQDHPNVTVAAVAELDPDKRAELARACRCATAYSSCEDLIEDDSLEAVFVATDAPSHARLAIAAPKPANMLHRPCLPCGDHWRMRMRFSPLPRLPIAAT